MTTDPRPGETGSEFIARMLPNYNPALDVGAYQYWLMVYTAHVRNEKSDD